MSTEAVTDDVNMEKFQIEFLVQKVQKMADHLAYQADVGASLGVRRLGSRQPAQNDDVVVSMFQKLIFHPLDPLLVPVFEISVAQHECHPETVRILFVQKIPGKKGEVIHHLEASK